jgi:hypothetical protein
MRWLLFVPIYLHHFSGRYPHIVLITINTSSSNLSLENESCKITNLFTTQFQPVDLLIGRSHA